MLRRSAGVPLASLLFLLLTVSPSRGTCERMFLTFANVPDQTILVVQPHVVVSIVGDFWTHDCFDSRGGGACERGPGDERPMTNIDVELRGTTDSVVIAEGISARGEDESWLLTFRVPELPQGTYRIYAHDGDAGAELSLRVSAYGPGWPPAST
jgi:hypothetical protein